MAELKIYPRDTHPKLSNGDIVEYKTKEDIICRNTDKICSMKFADFNGDGLRKTNSHQQKYQETIYQYKFERVSTKEVKRTNLLTNESVIISNVPQLIDGKKQAMDVQSFLSRRKKNNYHRIFGASGAEVWYGGKITLTEKKIADEVWPTITEKTGKLIQDFYKSTPNPADKKKHLIICSTDSNKFRNIINTGLEYKKNILHKSSSYVQWQDLLFFPSKMISDAYSKNKSSDFRDFNNYILEEIFQIKDWDNLMDIQVLKDEITNDPNGVGYTEMTDEEIATELNAKNKQVVSPILSTELLSWAAGNGRYVGIETLSNNGAASKQVRSIAKAAIKMIERDGTKLDTSKPEIMAMIDVLVAASAITVDDKTELLALANKTKSRAEELGLPYIYEGHIQAING